MENRIKKPLSVAELSPFRANPSATGAEPDLTDPLELASLDLKAIQLTETEKVDALREALNAKRHRISLERNRTLEKIRHIDQQIKGPQTAQALKDTIIGRGIEMAAREEWENPFQIPDFSYDIYQSLCYYFLKVEGEKASGMMHYHLSPRKGLLLYGGVGVGKTVLMKLFARNVLQSYTVVRCSEVETEYSQKDNAAPTLEKYSRMRPNPYLGNYYNQTELGCCFDDLGAEELGNNYGKRDTMIQILESRYDTCRGPKTHVTTNLSLEEIEKRYGLRVLDRMRQMFNLIEFPADIDSLRA